MQIFYCDMENFKHLYEECISLLPKKRRQKAERIINQNEALLSATAGLMIKEVLKVKEDEIKYGEHGKPYLEHGPFFSISHSRRYSVLAVSENEIGIDIEMHDTFNQRVAERCFTEEEQKFVKLSTENFRKIWTAKEAVLKFLGTGFSYSPKNFSVLPLFEEHEICGKKIKLFCYDINGAVFAAAYCGEEEFEFKEFQPEDLIY